MALTTCRECGRSGVSSDWRAICPGCGAPNPGYRRDGARQRALALGAAFLVVMLGVIAALVARR